MPITGESATCHRDKRAPVHSVYALDLPLSSASRREVSGSWGGGGDAVCSWMLNQSKKPFPAKQAWVTLQHLRDVFLAANVNTNAPRMPTTLTKTYFKPRTILHQTNTPFPTADLVFLLIWRILLHCSVPSIFLLTSPFYLDDGRRDFI